MASDLKKTLSNLVSDASKSLDVKDMLDKAGGAASKLSPNSSKDGHLGAKAAGATAAVLLPLAAVGTGKLVKSLGIHGLRDIGELPGRAVDEVTGKLGDTVSNAADGLGDKAMDSVKDKLGESGGAGGMLGGALKSALPFGGESSEDDDGGGGKGKGGEPGVGKGRRMPVQQSVDIGLPIETVYNQWTQFEEWPNFMHRVIRATQEDDCTVSFAVKMWTRQREFTAKIETQRPEERIAWSTTDGMTITGVVSFHELGPKLTRVLVGFDVEPGGMIEKMGRGMRYIKRAARADLHRFKAFIETQEHETGAWRGVIEDGELVQEHDASYDEQRQDADRSKRGPSDDKKKKRDGSRSAQGKSRAAAGKTSGRTRQASNRRRSASDSNETGRRSGSSRRSSNGTSSRRRARSGQHSE